MEIIVVLERQDLFSAKNTSLQFSLEIVKKIWGCQLAELQKTEWYLGKLSKYFLGNAKNASRLVLLSFCKLVPKIAHIDSKMINFLQRRIWCWQNRKHQKSDWLFCTCWSNRKVFLFQKGLSWRPGCANQSHFGGLRKCQDC